MGGTDKAAIRWDDDPFWLAVKPEAGRLMNQLRQLGVHQNDLEDVLHETLIRVMQAKDRYDPRRATVGAFAFGFAIRVVANHRRLVGRRQRFQAELAAAPSPKDTDPARQLEDIQRVRGALEKLSYNHRVVLIGADIEGMTVPELSEALGVNENTLYTRLREARVAFANALRAIDRGGDR